MPIHRKRLALQAILFPFTLLGLGLALPNLTVSAGSAASTPSAAPSGTINWYGQGLPIGTWDPVFSSAGHDVADLSLVYAALTRLGQNGVAQPGLASSWSWSSNALALTFDIRPGLTFTDGTPLEAQAVKASLDRARTAPGSLLATLLSAVSSETVLGPEVIRLNLSEPDPELLLTLGGKAGMVVSPAAFKDPTLLATHPDGAGPFKLTQFVADGYADLVRNPGYWDAQDIHVKGIYISGDTTASTTLAALESNEANVAVITGDQVAAAKAAGFNIAVIPTLSVANIEVNNTIAPFNNPLVVEAVNFALDRPAIVAATAFGYGTPDDEPFPPSYFGYNKSVANYYYYDPAKAKALLKEAGYKGTPVTITVPLPSPISEQIQAELQAVGIASTIKGIPFDELTQLVFVEHDVAFNPDGIVGRESPIAMLSLLWAADGLLNPGRNATPALTQALGHVATLSLSSPAFEPALQGLVALGIKDNPNIFLYSAPTIWAYAKDVHGVTGFIDYQRFEGITISN